MRNIVRFVTLPDDATYERQASRPVAIRDSILARVAQNKVAPSEKKNSRCIALYTISFHAYVQYILTANSIGRVYSRVYTSHGDRYVRSGSKIAREASTLLPWSTCRQTVCRRSGPPLDPKIRRRVYVRTSRTLSPRCVT